ncbi:unnamed protein product, partial [Adineta steineri]
IETMVNLNKRVFWHFTFKDILTILCSAAIPIALAIYTTIGSQQQKREAEKTRQFDLEQAEKIRQFDLEQVEKLRQRTLYDDFINNIFKLDNYGYLKERKNPWAFANAYYRAAHRQWDTIRKADVIQFLKEKQLIGRNNCSNGCRTTELDDIIRLNELNFDNVHLTSETGVLNKLNLQCVSFDQVSMSNATFTFASLNGVSFDGGRLDKVKFDGSSLLCASFNGVNLSGADFGNSNLAGAHFSNSDMSGVKISEDQINQASFHNVIMPNRDKNEIISSTKTEKPIRQTTTIEETEMSTSTSSSTVITHNTTATTTISAKTTTTTTTTSTTTTTATTATTTIITTTTTTTTTATTTATSTTTTATTTKSIITTTVITITTTKGCFYGEDLVSLIGGGQRRIKNLKIGDKVWSISGHHYDLVEDEIVLMMHNEPNQKAVFYTFQSVEGNQVSLTGSHNIPVFDTIRNEMTIKRADLVTTQDRLIMLGKTVEISNISITISQGFYAPLTLTGYLMVNNVSTSVFSANYKVSSAEAHVLFTPIRIYYHMTRWIYGNKYSPFVEIEEGIHPIPHFYKQHQVTIRFLLKLPKRFISTIIIITITYFIQKWTSKLLLKHKQKSLL